MNPQVPAAMDGSSLPLSASASLRLDRRDEVFIVTQGHVDLFNVKLAADEPTGIRRHLARLSPAAMFMGVPGTTGQALLAVGSLDCEVRVLPRTRLDTLPRMQQVTMVEQWVRTLAGPVFGGTPAWSEDTAEIGGEYAITAGRRLYAARDVVWLAPVEGRLRLADGTAELTSSGPCAPLTAGLGAVVATDARVQMLSTAQALERGSILDALDLFHAAALSPLGEQLDTEEREARQRLEAREAIGRASMSGAVGRLAGVLAGRASSAAHPGIHHPLAIAFSLAVSSLGIEPSAKALSGAGDRPSMPGMARAAGIGIRDVLLREDWWRRDAGPMVGYLQEGKAPVALLPDGRGGYRMMEAGSARAIAVDARVAERLASQAEQLYRPLPDALRRMGQLLRFSLQGSGRDFGTLALAGLLSGGMAALLPVATGFVFEWIIPRSELRQLPVIVVGLVLAALGAAVFDLTKAVAVLRMEARMESILQPALMQRLLALPVRFFRGHGIGDLTDRVLGVQRIRQLIAGSAIVSLLSVLFSVVSFGVILFYSPRLALLCAGLGLLAMLATLALSWAQLRHERVANELRGREDGLVVQLIQGIAKIRVSGGESRMFAVWAGLFAQRKARVLQAQRHASTRTLFHGVYPLLASLVLFAVAANLLEPSSSGKGLGLGAFLAVYAAFGQLLGAMTGMAGALSAAMESLPLFERLRPLVETEPEQLGDRNDPGPLLGAIDISRVSFRYAADAPLVVDDVSLRVEPGQFVAIVGASGSGKSTLLRLLLGFEKPESGDVLFQGSSITTLDPAALRRRMGVVLQGGGIVTGSIFDNVTGGLPYSHDEAWAAVRMAGLEDDIKAMPMGLHTLVIEGVSTFSGGQYQRLMIARALIGKPQLLLFDEATSALDNRSQALVTESLRRLHATRIVIAHRLSTIRDADCIHVLDNGRLVESGGYDELMARDGRFRALARRQLV